MAQKINNRAFPTDSNGFTFLVKLKKDGVLDGIKNCLHQCSWNIFMSVNLEGMQD
ncbi:MAG: hypothetical protein JXQ90_09740 [Cyclobacteriaceae bacterium]